jgi:hypothetical protein
MGHQSLRELCEGNLEVGSFTGDPEKYASKALEMDFVSTEALLLGNMERCFPRAIHRRNKFLYIGEFL